MICLFFLATTLKANPVSVNKVQNPFDYYSVSLIYYKCFFSYKGNKIRFLIFALLKNSMLAILKIIPSTEFHQSCKWWCRECDCRKFRGIFSNDHIFRLFGWKHEIDEFLRRQSGKKQQQKSFWHVKTNSFYW